MFESSSSSNESIHAAQMLASVSHVKKIPTYVEGSSRLVVRNGFLLVWSRMIEYHERRKSKLLDDGYGDILQPCSLLSWFLDLMRQLRSRKTAFQLVKDHAAKYDAVLGWALAQRASAEWLLEMPLDVPVVY